MPEPAQHTTLEDHLRARRSQREILLMTYIVLGYPSFDDSLRVLESMVEAGVDLMELQIPFSEPIADDPVILHANQHALANGSRVERCLRCAEAVARRFDIPFLVMSYYDILLFRTSPPCSTPTSRAASLPRACRSRSASA